MKNIPKKLKLILAAFGTILLGAFGSGLWNTILAPSLSIIMNYILSIISLGLNVIKNNIYLDIAKGLREQAALSWLQNFSTFLITMPFAFILLYFLGFPILKNLKDKVKKSEYPIVYHNTVTIILCLLLVFCSSFFYIDYIFIKYKNQAVTHFYQLNTICKPYLETQKEEIILSKFAQIKNKDDYVKIIDELKAIAKKNKCDLPKFNPW